jgi:hypothetical protein
VSDSSASPSVGASARGDDTRGGGGEGCGGAAAAAAPSSRVASLRAGSRCVNTRPPHMHPQLAANSMLEKTVGLTSLLALRTDDSPELTLPCTTTGTRAAPWALAVWFLPKRSSHAEREAGAHLRLLRLRAVGLRLCAPQTERAEHTAWCASDCLGTALLLTAPAPTVRESAACRLEQR